MKHIFIIYFCLFAFSGLIASSFDDTKDLPNLYQGRIRSLDSTAQLWLYDINHKRHTPESTALDLSWHIHFNSSPEIWDTPLFWIQYADTKNLLKLDPSRDRFSFHELTHAIEHVPQETRDVQKVKEIIEKLNSFKDFPENSLRMLPSKNNTGTWMPLSTLMSETNFTAFSDMEYKAIRSAYLRLQSETLAGNPEAAALNFAETYKKAYEYFEGMPYKKAAGKALTFPTQQRLFFETLYYRIPFIDFAIGLYIFALLTFVWKTNISQKIGWICFLIAFAIHTFTLCLRSYILGRPPVTNMFETVIYVPWIAVALAAFLAWKQKTKAILTAGILAAIVLLIVLKLSALDARMENVQAVLDSQFWLIIHVLMVVGSYGAFILSGILGHIYLINYAIRRKNLDALAQGILHTLYIGVALLIPGTILGGIWAAESWGRFWDWDPKESWAFISACIYLIIIHAYTFRKIGDLGLAVGSIIGVISISFTWYGVNYILGTGLHSYGFGAGDTLYYYAYLLAEITFLCGFTIYEKSSLN